MPEGVQAFALAVAAGEALQTKRIKQGDTGIRNPQSPQQIVGAIDLDRGPVAHVAGMGWKRMRVLLTSSLIDGAKRELSVLASGSFRPVAPVMQRFRLHADRDPGCLT